jgi:murein L,D-transpeptidase YafK
MGKVVGDKEEEGDLKTPEGIYQFTQKLTPPSIKPKFGDIAFYINYPNTFDQVAGRTGYDIMLHATDAPDRLKKNYDSEGCVVVNNHEIREIGEYLRMGLTPILIYPEWKPEYVEPSQTQDLEKFFTHWVTSWESKDINLYMDGYHSHFIGDGRDKEEWRIYKTGLNKKYGKITVTIENPMYFKHPKYSVVLFSQNYVSYWPSDKTDIKDMKVAFKSRGTKMLYIAEEKGVPKIIAESFTNQVW